MDAITTIDSRRRGIFPPPFQPGDVVITEYQDSRRITFRLIEPAEVPVVKSAFKNGVTMLRAPGSTRRSIADAVRADRDAR
jgi:hypothetical protein